MLIKQWMTHEVVSVLPDTSLLKCKSLLRDMNISHLPVVDKQGHVVGLLCSDDIKEFSPQHTTGLEVLELLDILAETPAKQIMVVAPHTIHIDETVENAAILMDEKRVNCLPVVDSNDKLVGIVTESDIFKTFISITGSRTESVQMAFVLENKPGTLRAILASGIPQVAMISCNPSTLARDLGILTGSLVETAEGLKRNPAYTQGGIPGYYELRSVLPLDMFPQTKHVETLVCLERK